MSAAARAGRAAHWPPQGTAWRESTVPRAPEALDSYFDEQRFAAELELDGLHMTFEGIDRPLEAYTRALSCVGFLIEELCEPKPATAALAAAPTLAKAARRPYFLHMRCVLTH